MKLIRTLVCLLALPVVASGAETVAHFTRVEVPAEEQRLMDLQRLQEWRCKYEFDHPGQEALLIAEYYKGGVATAAYVLSRATLADEKEKGKGDKTDKATSGSFTIAWHRDFHNLLSTQENAYIPGAAHLADFRAQDGFFFNDSAPETRPPSGKNAAYGMKFQLYPVLGISGERQLQFPGDATRSGQSFVDACTKSGAKDAVIVWLYFSRVGEMPCMDFAKSDPPDAPDPVARMSGDPADTKQRILELEAKVAELQAQLQAAQAAATTAAATAITPAELTPDEMGRFKQKLDAMPAETRAELEARMAKQTPAEQQQTIRLILAMPAEVTRAAGGE